MPSALRDTCRYFAFESFLDGISRRYLAFLGAPPLPHKNENVPPNNNNEQFTNHLLVVFSHDSTACLVCRLDLAAKELRTSAFKTIVTLNLHLVEGQLQSV